MKSRCRYASNKFCVPPPGIEAYSFSTVFAWYSLRSVPHAQTFRFLDARVVGHMLGDTQKFTSFILCAPTRNRTWISSLGRNRSIH